ncbi:MAG: ice-binding family protein, partial [Methylovulum sp.]|nr:ice-binding family protein [Methylovulum sp.]
MKMTNYLPILPLVAIGALYAFPSASSASILGSAQSFAVLGYAGVTNAHSDPNPQTEIWGNVGVDPLTLSSITGFPPGVVTGGTLYGPGGLSSAARNDATAAYSFLAGLHGDNLSDSQLGGLTLTPGVYHFDTSAQLTGILTLDFLGNPYADFVFQIGSTLTTLDHSSVSVINGGSLSGIYWQVGSSASLGADSLFAGNIIAQASVNLEPGAEILCGRSFALTGAVTLSDNLISSNCASENFGSSYVDYNSIGFSGSQSVPEAPPLTRII